MAPTSFKTFNDGVCAVYRVENVAGAGEKPKKGLREKYGRIPFERRKVGLMRFYQAKQADVKITDVIRIPRQMGISTNDVCLIGDAQYQVRQAQLVPDTLPQSVDLTLERLEAAYDAKPVS